MDNGDSGRPHLVIVTESASRYGMSNPYPQSGRQAGLRKDPLWNFRLVGAFVPRATAKACEKHGFHAAEIILNWQAIVGPELAAFTAPRRIRWPKAPTRDGDIPQPTASAGRGVKSALEMWVEGGRAHEIPYLKGPIIARINTYFGYRAITEIRIVQAPVVCRLNNAAPKVWRPAARPATPASTADTPLGQALDRLAQAVARNSRTDAR